MPATIYPLGRPQRSDHKMRRVGKTGGVLLEKVLRGKIENGWVLCPRCKAKLGRLAYGGKVYGYIQKCDRCKILVQIEVID